MRKASLRWTLMTLAPLAIFACSSDDPPPAGTTGSAGKAGAGGSAGSTVGAGGSGQGGSAGKGGSSAGTGGTGAGGSAGTGGTGGGGAGTGGSAGSPVDSGTDAPRDGSTSDQAVTDSTTDAPRDGTASDAPLPSCIANTGTNPLIADMEGTMLATKAVDGRTANDVGNLNPPYTTKFEQILESDAGTNKVLHVLGSVPGGGFFSHETGLNLTPTNVPCYDASAYGGITLKIRGSSTSGAPAGLGANTARIYLLTKATRSSTLTPSGNCTVPADAGAVTCGHPSKDIALTGTMTEVKIKWTDFAIPSWQYNPGTLAADYGKTVYAIQLDVFGAGPNAADGAVPPNVDFEYWLDDVAFTIGTD